MGLIHVTVALRSFERVEAAYEADFLVDAGASDSMAPASELRRIGVGPAGRILLTRSVFSDSGGRDGGAAPE